eukprot:9226733-Lingulodinium_polyedra.AAC.1
MRRPKTGLNAERTNVQRASRCGNETPARPHHFAMFYNRCAMIGLSRRFAAATARTPHAGALHGRTNCRP